MKKLKEEGFLELCTVGELKDSCGRKFIINDVEIAVFKINSEIFILSNICPHQQSHLIYDGFIEDEFVVCPAHGWKFNLRSGKKEAGGNGLQVYPAEVADDKVFVKVCKKSINW